MKSRIDLDAVHTQLCNALEMERCAIRVYEHAMPYAGPAGRWMRWKAARDEAQRNAQSLTAILQDLLLDAECDSAQRRSVRCVGDALLRSLQQAPSQRSRESLANECVRIVEQRERQNWELLGQVLAVTPAETPAPPPRAPRGAYPGAVANWLDHAVHYRLRQPATAAQPL